MNEEKRMNGGYEIKLLRAVKSGVQSLLSGITPKPRTLMCVGTVRTDQIISGGIIAISFPKQGIS